MATLSRTWVFLSNAEGLVEVGDSAALSALWTGADGNPVGSIEWRDTTSAINGSVIERMRDPAGQNWGGLFPGLPVGSNITAIQITAWQYIRWNLAGIATGTSAPKIRIVDATPATIHSAGDLLTGTIASGSDTVFQTGPTGANTPSRAINSGSQPYASIARFEIEFGYTRDATAGPNVDWEYDNVTLQITYDPPSPSIYQEDHSRFPKPPLFLAP